MYLQLKILVIKYVDNDSSSEERERLGRRKIDLRDLAIHHFAFSGNKRRNGNY